MDQNLTCVEPLDFSDQTSEQYPPRSFYALKKPLFLGTTPTNGCHDPHFFHDFALLHHPIVAQQCTQVLHKHPKTPLLQLKNIIKFRFKIIVKAFLGTPTNEVKTAVTLQLQRLTFTLHIDLL
jgi:hypothetical protein